MIFDIGIYLLVGVFITVCISLIIFNFVIIRYGRERIALSASVIERWKDILYKQTIKASGRKFNKSKHERFLLRKLSRAENLVAYSYALQHLKSDFPVNYSNYIEKKDAIFQKLSNTYSRKSSIERTCFADFVCNFPQVAGGMYGQLLMGTLISYIGNSNVNCRTAVMRALCNIGNAEGVVNALRAINDKSLFIHNQLLVDVLSNFRGNKEILMEYLWNEAHHWNDNILISVIQFITKFSEDYNEAFLPILQDSSANSEVRIAVIQYYAENIYEPACLTLIELAANPTEIDLATEAASALRYNERLGDKTDLQEVMEDDSDILAYMLGLKGA